MKYVKNGLEEFMNDFLKLIKRPDAMLHLDNDMCYIEWGPRSKDGERSSKSFDYSPTELVIILARHNNIKVQKV